MCRSRVVLVISSRGAPKGMYNRIQKGTTEKTNKMKNLNSRKLCTFLSKNPRILKIKNT